MAADALHPTTALLVKIGSIAVHAEELLSDDWHAFDHTAMKGLLDDPEVKAWRRDMDKLALLPKMRKAKP